MVDQIYFFNTCVSCYNCLLSCYELNTKWAENEIFLPNQGLNLPSKVVFFPKLFAFCAKPPYYDCNKCWEIPAVFIDQMSNFLKKRATSLLTFLDF